MGLNRYFEISATDREGNEIFDPGLADQVQEAIEDKYDWWEGSLHCGGTLTCDGANWYDVEDDMKDVSGQYPDLIFEVICTGDNLEDIWTAYFCGGRCSYSYLEWVPEDRDYLLTGVGSGIKLVALTAAERRLLREALDVYEKARIEEADWTLDNDVILANLNCAKACAELYNKLLGEENKQ